MATSKTSKSRSSKSATKSTARKTSASSAKAKRPAAKKKTTKAAPKKTSAKKSAPKSTKATKTKQEPEDFLANNALKFINQASSLLSSGVQSGRHKTLRARQDAAKKAQSLLESAHSDLSKALNTGSSTVRGLLKKLEP